MGNMINNLNVVVNDEKYMDDKIYVTFTIKFGYAVNKILFMPEKEIVEVNSSNGNILINYLSLYLRKKHRIYINGRVLNNMMYLSFQAKGEKINDVISIVSNALYDMEVIEESFETAKKTSIENFTENYAESSFKGYYKIMEFANIHKNFNFIKLKRDLEKSDFAGFKFFKENIVCHENSVLYINGNVQFLDEENLVKVIEAINTKKREVRQVVDPIDDYLTEDRCIVAKMDKKFEIGCINFEFLNKEMAALDKFTLLNIIAKGLFKNKGLVVCDEFDSSIVYVDEELKAYKNELHKYLEDEKVNETKTYILNVISFLLKNKPYDFNILVACLYAQGIDINTYIKVLENLKGEDLRLVYKKGDIKVVEGQVKYM